MNRSWLLLLSCACGSGAGELGGSIGGSYDLGFDATRAYSIGAEVVILYEKKLEPKQATTLGPTIMNQVVRLRLDTNRQALSENVDIPLDAATHGHDCAEVSRYVLVEEQGELVQERAFPDVARFTIRFRSLPEEVGDVIAGKFEVVFTDDRLLGGKFETTLSEP